MNFYNWLCPLLFYVGLVEAFIEGVAVAKNSTADDYVAMTSNSSNGTMYTHSGCYEMTAAVTNSSMNENVTNSSGLNDLFFSDAATTVGRSSSSNSSSSSVGCLEEMDTSGEYTDTNEGLTSVEPTPNLRSPLTRRPTLTPANRPSIRDFATFPTVSPTISPTVYPTISPTTTPTVSPTNSPTTPAPSTQIPSSSPSDAPTELDLCKLPEGYDEFSLIAINDALIEANVLYKGIAVGAMFRTKGNQKRYSVLNTKSYIHLREMFSPVDFLGGVEYGSAVKVDIMRAQLEFIASNAKSSETAEYKVLVIPAGGLISMDDYGVAGDGTKTLVIFNTNQPVTILASSIVPSILAPFAKVTLTNNTNNVDGFIVAETLETVNIAGTRFHGKAFQGKIDCLLAGETHPPNQWTPLPTPFPTTPAPTSLAPSPRPSLPIIPVVEAEAQDDDFWQGLGRCQGDCDDDTDCAGIMQCFRREAGDPAPYGCAYPSFAEDDGSALSAETDTSDYCIEMDLWDPNLFRLRLYWEEGYFWQEDTDEQFFCMAHSMADDWGSCFYGAANSRECEKDTIYMDVCSADYRQLFSFIEITKDDYFNVTPGEFMIAAGNKPHLCLHTGRPRLQECNPKLPGQRWIAMDQGRRSATNQRRFELSKVGKEDRCLTQHHHPRAKEVLDMIDCVSERLADTTYWQKF